MNKNVNETYDILPCRNNNFARLFELPVTYPETYCFNGGYEVGFKLVDFFNPIPYEDFESNTIRPWSEYKPMLLDFLKNKVYIKPNRKYILITDFNKTLLFTGE
jgi:hypothetical protein